MTHTRFSNAVALGIIGCLSATSVAFAQGGNAPRAPVAHPATNPSCTLAPTPGVAFSTVVGTSWVFHWETPSGSGSDGAAVKPLIPLESDATGAAVGNMSFIQVADPNSQTGEAGFINVIETRNVFAEEFSPPGTAPGGTDSASTGKTRPQIASGGPVGGIFRFLNYIGRFQIYADCTGGTLTFSTGVGPVDFDFYFRKLNGDPFGSLVMVSTDSNSFVAKGEAEKQGPS